MVRRGEVDLDIKRLHYVLVEVGGERIAVVRHRDCGGSEARHKLHEGLRAVGRRRRLHWIALYPPGGPIQDREEEPAAL